MPAQTSSGSTTGTLLGIGAVLLLGVAVMTVARDRDASDTDLPPDPFESNEPRVVDCVGDWQGTPEIAASVYCEVGDGTTEGRNDYTDAENLDRSPYTWSTTATTGDLAIIDMYLSAPSSGACAIWVDGEFVADEPIEAIVDEEGAADGTDITSYYCGIEVTIQ